MHAIAERCTNPCMQHIPPAGRQKFAFDPGHRNNIFQARMLPNTSNKTIISCAADGQVNRGFQTLREVPRPSFTK
jgi:hypothetical protein